MANKTMSAISADFATHAASLASSDSDVTAGEWAALSAVFEILSRHPGYALPIMKLLSDTHKALLAPG